MSRRKIGVRGTIRLPVGLFLTLLALFHSPSCACAQSGHVWGWGDNRYGQLGLGAFDTAPPYGKTMPTQTASLADISGVRCGFYHTLFVKADGTVWASGYNTYGQLGLGTFDTESPYGKNTPTQVPGLSGVIAVAGGQHHSMALKGDRTLWTWGWNNAGQLGDGTFLNRNLPVAIASLESIIAIAAGSSHSLALQSNGTLWAWGANDAGQLGDGSFSQRTRPVAIPNFYGALAIAAGQSHSLALRADGTVWAWGLNANGQLGTGTSASSNAPVPVKNLTGIVAISAGSFHSLALKSDGTLWAWGWNKYGQLGDGSTTSRNIPVQVGALAGVRTLSAGQNHSLALLSDGTVWTWGWNAAGQLGDGTTTNRKSPVAVSGLTGALTLAGGGNRTLALTISDNPVSASVSGVLTLDSLAVDKRQPIYFEFRPTNGQPVFYRSTGVGLDGTYTLSHIPRNRYALAIKGPKYLRKVVTLDLTVGDAHGLDATLFPGDIDDDNEVGIGDMTPFYDSYGSQKGDKSFSPLADFTGDDVVDLDDLVIFNSNYGLGGDP